MRKITLFTLFLGAAALVFAAGAYAQTSEFVDADGDGISDNVAQMHMHHPFGMGPGHELRGLMANLTAEQRAEVEALVQSLKDEGKTPQEIHTALGEKLQSFGITLPENWDRPRMPGRGMGWRGRGGGQPPASK